MQVQMAVMGRVRESGIMACIFLLSIHLSIPLQRRERQRMTKTDTRPGSDVPERMICLDGELV